MATLEPAVVACAKAGVAPVFQEYVPKNAEATDAELLALSWSLNEARRQLSTSQRACAAAEIIERMPDEAKGKGGKRRGTNREITIGPALERYKVGEQIVLNQFSRQNLTPFTRAELVLKLEPLLAAEGRKRKSEAGGDKRSAKAKEKSPCPKLDEAVPPKTRDSLASLSGISHGTLAKVKLILAHADADERGGPGARAELHAAHDHAQQEPLVHRGRHCTHK